MYYLMINKWYDISIHPSGQICLSNSLSRLRAISFYLLVIFYDVTHGRTLFIDTYKFVYR